MGLNFVAIAFDSASFARGAAFAVAMVRVRDGKAEASDSFICPSLGSGIERTEVWGSYLTRITGFLGGDHLLSYDFDFEGSTLGEMCAAVQSGGYPRISFYSASKLVKSAIPSLQSHTLQDVTELMKLDVINDRTVNAEALAIALMCLELAEYSKADTIERLMQGYRIDAETTGVWTETGNDLPRLHWQPNEDKPEVQMKEPNPPHRALTRRELRAMEAESNGSFSPQPIPEQQNIGSSPASEVNQILSVATTQNDVQPTNHWEPPATSQPSPIAGVVQQVIIPIPQAHMASSGLSDGARIMHWTWWTVPPMMFLLCVLSATADLSVAFALSFIGLVISTIGVPVTYFVRKSRYGSVATMRKRIGYLEESLRKKDEESSSMKNAALTLQRKHASETATVNKSHTLKVAKLQASLDTSTEVAKNTKAQLVALTKQEKLLQAQIVKKEMGWEKVQSKLCAELGAKEVALNSAQTREISTSESNSRMSTEIRKLKIELGQAVDLVERYNIRDILTMERDRDAIRSSISVSQEELSSLQKEIISAQDEIIATEVGLFDFSHVAESSVRLADELAEVRRTLKSMVRDKTACTYSSNFSFNGSAAEGKKFCERMVKIMLSAYNAESENAIKGLRSTEHSAAAKNKINRSLERVTKNGEMIKLSISEDYHALRLREVELAYRHLLMVKIEKEIERERREEQREQEKANQELREEHERLEKELQHYRNTLRAVRAKGDEEAVTRMEEKIEEVSYAIENVDSRAANTRAGHVYIISNVGAFGEGIVKIGMTRRLEPMDRVKELGDASVPFRFDTHALFFAEDAVGVENILHKHFAPQRVNRVNLRREFFYTTPHAVLEALKEHSVEIVEFKAEFEAEEYRVSQEIMAAEMV